MKKEQGFSLIELLIVVAIIAIIAAIAVPSMLSARMAANESGAIQGLRTVGSAQVAYAAINNQNFNGLAALVTAGNLDGRFTAANGFNGYSYAEGEVNGVTGVTDPAQVFAVLATPVTEGSSGRYTYGINHDQIVRYMDVASGHQAPMCGASPCEANDPIGISK
ncbi:MAG TPA: prepilin-type N-terminal cleavage/methylation domain-containing protein [Acidobacteriota bacterium]|nr:prepilin-type N-terminal cleavage/methylation domain-containing protein [Acidobacteriota bacterium]